MLPAQVQLILPPWVHEAVDLARAYPGDAEKVGLAVALSRHNIDRRSGGPFGAAVFDADDRVIAVGVNLVLPQACSLAHAETMAYMLAQQRTRRSRLNLGAAGERLGPIALATSSQPCCQCYGATFWAGIDRVLIGARSADVMALTDFDEGPLPADWIGELERRGIEVVRDQHRAAARDVLRSYGQHGGHCY